MRASTPGLFSDQHREDVLAARVDPAAGLEVLEVEDFLGAGLTHGLSPTMSRAAWPAGIIG